VVKKIFFQSSLPRAGSTLLQNIIGQNPNFYVTPTSGFLELVYGARKDFTSSIEFKAQGHDNMSPAFFSFCREGMFGYFNKLTDKPFVLDKSRGWGIHYNFLNSFYPNPKIVCMIRDLRSIYSSMEKNFRKNQHLDLGVVDHIQMKGTTTEKRIDLWANSQPVGLAIERLYQIFKEGTNQNILFVKYEDLILDSKTQIDRVYDFFEIESFNHDFNNIQQITQEDDSVYGIFGDHKIQSKIEKHNDDSELILGKNVCDWIKNNYKWYYDIFQYD
jgi:sulfotransferase